MTNSDLSRRTVLLAGAAVMAAASAGKALSMESTGKQNPNMRQRPFDRDKFVEDCVSAHRADGMDAVRDVLAEAISDHRAVLKALGGPTRAGLDVMYTSPDFTIFAAHWTPQMNLLPHDHMMAALIGIYTGREDNILWRNGEDGIEAYQASCLFEGDIATLPPDAIHSVTNPLQKFTGGIHIYDGDFFETERHQWDPETLAEQPSDGDAIRAMFARENERHFGKCAS